MVIFGGLEVVAAGYLIHKHNQNKRERERLREAEELIEEEEDALRRESRRRQRHDQKLQNEAQYATQPLPPYQPRPEPERERRRRRSNSRDRKHASGSGSSHRRHRDEDQSRQGRRREQSAPPAPLMPTQMVVEPGIVTGWPSNWEQAHTPQPIVTPPVYSQTNLHPNSAREKGDRRGRSTDDLRAGSRTPSPRVRFNDGTRPGEDRVRRSPPPRYE